MKKYYWVLFHVTKRIWIPNKKVMVEEIWHEQQIDIHPVEFRLEMNNKYGQPFEYTPPTGGKS